MTNEERHIVYKLSELAVDICRGMSRKSGEHYKAHELSDEFLPGWEVDDNANVQVVHLYGSSYGPPANVEVCGEIGEEDADWLIDAADLLEEEVDSYLSAHARLHTSDFAWLSEDTWYLIWSDNRLLFVRIYEEEA